MADEPASIVVLADREGTIVGLTGPRDVLGTSIYGWLSDDDRSLAALALEAAFDRGQSHSFEVLVDDGWYDVRVRPVVSPEGIDSVAFVAKDVTERKRLEGDARSRLSPRELDVLRGLADGLTNAEIGTALQISPRTVEIHKSNLMRKLGFERTADLLRYAFAHGIARH